MQARLFHLHALSALHCGTGQSVGVVDLPIARARATKLPIVPGSSLRGVLRQHIANSNPQDAKTLFGPEFGSGDSNSFAGALAIGDAHLLALPVRSLAGIVSYVTAPFILHRYARDLERSGASAPKMPSAPAPNGALAPPESVNCIKEKSERKLVLEDLDLEAREDASLTEWAKCIAQAAHPADSDAQHDFVKRFALLPDEIMDFLSETATEIRARIAIDQDAGTVRDGALWYEENLPAEAVLWGVFALCASNNKDDSRSETQLAKAISRSNTLLQLGGKSGVGRGLVRFLTSEEARA